MNSRILGLVDYTAQPARKPDRIEAQPATQAEAARRSALLDHAGMCFCEVCYPSRPIPRPWPPG